jgi:adenine-specific DNA-methyltransferase
MKLQIQSSKQSLNKAYLKEKISRSDIELFKKNLTVLLSKINEHESEEHHKNLISDFLKDTWYKELHEINTRGREDLVIHTGKTAKDPVGVLLEVKKPTNKNEMISEAKPNAKALQELILYYLQERIDHNNIDIKFLIITNINEWYIFDEVIFEKFVFRNVKLKKDFENWKHSGNDTRFFYESIAAPFLDSLPESIVCTSFDIRHFSEIVLNSDKTDDNKLIALYKILSPVHLLKKPFVNDSNSLDKAFYSELLHIIGLTETKEGGKKLIERKKEGERNSASLLESAISQLDTLDKISRIDKPHLFGTTLSERLLNVSLELIITWVNRILFLKLLEAQLIKYHKGDKSYAFLNSEKVKNFDDLNNLFFSVLARKQDERNADVKTAFAKVPYLNSSLFEPTELEHSCLFISQLKDGKLPFISSTVQKDPAGKKRTGELDTLAYFFEFLNAYDFSSEGSEDIQEDNKTLISASVLGLIFEKINGYKDGSFFTPSFITMYMCRETIRRAVVQKFNETKSWTCTSIDELFDKIDDKKEANTIVNSLKICDPAVGSGHFLVSALNEIITVKSDLKILLDRHGKTLRDYQVEVVNDELIITDDDLEFFEYNPNNKESQRIQETLFHEKQTIIENCLFGVDINPNSVKICRLRLWIELLKNAYYLPSLEGPGVRLETLPNIDINIKCGNSLISRYALDADIRKALKRSKWSIDSYRLAVMTYRNAQSKDEKRAMTKLIDEIKNDFESEVASNDKRLLKLNKSKGELLNLTTQTTMFERSKAEKAAWDKQVKAQTDTIVQLETELQEVKSNKIYENAFEWRFEFPEVLNDEGDFIGFDVVIGNPPYMRIQEIQACQPIQKIYYEQNYHNAKASYDLANLFFELAVNVSALKGNSALIFPHKFFNSASSEVFRDYLKNGQYIDEIAHFGANMVFEDADTYTCIAQFSKRPSEGFNFQMFPFKSDFKNLLKTREKYSFMTYQMIDNASFLYGSNQWILFNSKVGFDVFKKIYNNCIKLENYLEGIFVGLQTSKDELFVLDRVSKEKFVFKVPISGNEYELEPDLFKPFLMGKDIQRYSYLSTDKYVFFPYKIENGNATIVPETEIESKYPLTYKYLKDHEKQFKARESGKSGKKEYWYAHGRENNLQKFEQPKLSSMEICSNHPNVILNDQDFYHATTVYSWVKKQDTKESYEYLLAIANSKLLWWFLKTTGDTLQGDARRFKTNYLNPFPLPQTVNEQTEQIITTKVKLVLNARKANSNADTTINESEIDQLVYQLYGLTEDEIKLIENE